MLRKRVLSAAAVSVMLAAATVSAGSAASGNHLSAGTAGRANCLGQTQATVSQSIQNQGLGDVIQPGSGNLADLYGISQQELKRFIRAYCD